MPGTLNTTYTCVLFATQLAESWTHWTKYRKLTSVNIASVCGMLIQVKNVVIVYHLVEVTKVINSNMHNDCINFDLCSTKP